MLHYYFFQFVGMIILYDIDEDKKTPLPVTDKGVFFYGNNSPNGVQERLNGPPQKVSKPQIYDPSYLGSFGSGIILLHLKSGL